MRKREKYAALFNETVALMREYVEREMPQSFAAVFGLFKELMKTCEILKIKMGNVDDLYEYAKKEEIEQFGF